MNPLLDEVRAWLHKARSDLLSAGILVESSPLVLGPAAFHCQQAAEKVLKAFLIWRSVPFERVHSLVYLMDLCEAQEPAFASLREETESLASYAGRDPLSGRCA
jgi:HEPN domain-containing protein